MDIDSGHLSFAPDLKKIYIRITICKIRWYILPTLGFWSKTKKQRRTDNNNNTNIIITIITKITLRKWENTSFVVYPVYLKWRNVRTRRRPLFLTIRRHYNCDSLSSSLACCTGALLDSSQYVFIVDLPWNKSNKKVKIMQIHLDEREYWTYNYLKKATKYENLCNNINKHAEKEMYKTQQDYSVRSFNYCQTFTYLFTYVCISIILDSQTLFQQPVKERSKMIF